VATVTITIAGRAYEIACDDGHGGHITQLAREVDRRAQALVSTIGAVADAKLMAMVGLVMADELAEAKAEIDRLKGMGVSAPSAQDAGAPDDGALDRALSTSIEALASRIDGIAERLQKA
jgi:cell division protein ZapA